MGNTPGNLFFVPTHKSLADVDVLTSDEEEWAWARLHKLKIRRIIVKISKPSMRTFGHLGYRRISEGSYVRTEFHYMVCECGGCVPPPIVASKKKRTKKASAQSDTES